MWNLSKQAIPPLLPCSDIVFVGKEQVLIYNNKLIICSLGFISKWKTSVKTYATVGDNLASNQTHSKFGVQTQYIVLGSRDGAVVRALASDQCGSGSIPRLGVTCGLSFLLVLTLAPRGFSLRTPVFLSPLKPAFPNSNSIWRDLSPHCKVHLIMSLWNYAGYKFTNWIPLQNTVAYKYVLAWKECLRITGWNKSTICNKYVTTLQQMVFKGQLNPSLHLNWCHYSYKTGFEVMTRGARGGGGGGGTALYYTL